LLFSISEEIAEQALSSFVEQLESYQDPES